jgi:hypothetical protein
VAPPAVVHLAAEGAAPREGARTDRCPNPLAPGPNHASRTPQPDRPKAMCDGQPKLFYGDFLRSTFLYPNGLEHPRSGTACNNPFAFYTLIRGKTLSSIVRNVDLDTGFYRGGVPITAGSTASRSSCNNMEMDSVALTFISPPRRGPPVAQKVKTPSPKSAVPIALSDDDRGGAPFRPHRRWRPGGYPGRARFSPDAQNCPPAGPGASSRGPNTTCPGEGMLASYIRPLGALSMPPLICTSPPGTK